MSLHPTSPIQRIRWLKCKNAGGQTVPPYGVLNCSDTQNGVLMVGPPTSDNQTGVFVNSQQPIQPNGYGSCTSDSPCYVAYNSQAGTPAAGQAWGTQAGFFYLNPNQTGFTIRGDAVATPFPRVLADHGGGGGGGGGGSANTIQTQLSDNSIVIPNTGNLEFDAATFAMQDLGSGNAIVFGSRGFQPIIGCRMASLGAPLNQDVSLVWIPQIEFGLGQWIPPLTNPNRITFPYTGYYLSGASFLANVPGGNGGASNLYALADFFFSAQNGQPLDSYRVGVEDVSPLWGDGASKNQGILNRSDSFGLMQRTAGDTVQGLVNSNLNQFAGGGTYQVFFWAYLVGVNPGGGGVNPTGA